MSTIVQESVQVATAPLGVSTEIISGVGAARQLAPALVRRSVRSAVVVTGPHTGKLRIAQEILDGMRGAAIAYTVAPPRENRFPMVSDRDALATLCREKTPDIVIAIGGGAVMDLAKAAVIVAAEGNPAQKGPVAVVPTMFPGSEANGGGNIRGGKEGTRGAFRDPKVTPCLVILDPAAGEGQAPIDAVGSALNAYAHCTDALCVRGRSPFSDALAAEGIRLANSALPAFALDPAHPVARVEMQWASVFGGMVIQHAFVGVHHGLSHGLVDICGMTHGNANGMMLPYTIAWHLRELKGRDRQRLNDALPDRWFETLSSAKIAAGLPLSLREAGVPKDELQKLVAYGLRHGTAQNEILAVTEESLLGIVTDAYEGGSLNTQA